MHPAADQDPYAPVRAFVHDLDDLIDHQGETSTIVLAVKARLSALLKQRPALPAQVRMIRPECYARHLLYGDPRGRYEVVVMAWGPGQQTPVHDHSGIWCVEGVFEGVVDVTRYDLQELIGENVARMRRTEVIHAGRGKCGALIPPVEYHRISNPYDRPAYTVHVYGGRMRTCRVFKERGEDTYEIAIKDLVFNSSQAEL